MSTFSLYWSGRYFREVDAGVILETLAGAPYFLGYFNLPSRLFFNREDMLVDSHLDWGQDLGRLKRYMDEHSHRPNQARLFRGCQSQAPGTTPRSSSGHRFLRRVPGS
jgi:hypothetical protein